MWYYHVMQLQTFAEMLPSHKLIASHSSRHAPGWSGSQMVSRFTLHGVSETKVEWWRCKAKLWRFLSFHRFLCRLGSLLPPQRGCFCFNCVKIKILKESIIVITVISDSGGNVGGCFGSWFRFEVYYRDRGRLLEAKLSLSAIQFSWRCTIGDSCLTLILYKTGSSQ